MNGRSTHGAADICPELVDGGEVVAKLELSCIGQQLGSIVAADRVSTREQGKVADYVSTDATGDALGRWK